MINKSTKSIFADRTLILSVFGCFAISWVVVSIFGFFNGFALERFPAPYFYAFALGLMWIPGLCGLFFAHRDGFKIPLFTKPNGFYFLASLTAFALVMITLGLSRPLNTLLFPFGHQLDSQIPSTLLILGVVLLAGMTVNMLVALGEEIFWRGYLYEKLKYLGIIKASMITGILWGLWHAPVILMGYNYPEQPWLGLLMMILLTTALSPLLFYFRERGGSVMVPAAFHGTINAGGTLTFLFFADPNPLIVGATGLIGILVFTTASILVLTGSRKKI